MSKAIINTQEGLEKEIKRMKRMKSKDHNATTKLTVFYAILFAFLIVYVVCLLCPLIWTFITSFRARLGDYDTNELAFPVKWSWNYGFVLSRFYIGINEINVGVIPMYLYSLLYAIGNSFIAILVPCLTAYLCAKFNYRFNKVIVSIVIVTMTIPIVGALPSALQMSKSLGFYDNIWGMWIQSGSFLGSNFLIFMTMWKGVPKDFSEAAKVDGASNWRILLQVMIPLAKNTFITLMLLSFIGLWNDYMTPKLYLPSYPTAAYGLWKMQGSNIYDPADPSRTMDDIPVRMASAIILALPTLILFCCFQKRLVGNLSMGGVKG